MAASRTAAQRKKLGDEAVARATRQPPGRSLIPKVVRDTLSPVRRTPVVGHVAYYGIIGGLVVAGIIEPLPTAVLMAGAHFLIGSGNPIAQEAGEALR